MNHVALKNGRKIGAGHPVYIIAEIGINHNGSVEIAKKLIDWASIAGCDAVKFQKRTPELCVPKDQWEKQRQTPWGTMSYIDYKRKTEFGKAEFEEIDQYCQQKKIDWFASAWDEPSVDFLEQFNPVMYKLASASLTDFDLIKKVLSTERPLMLSTGMSTEMEIEDVVARFRVNNGDGSSGTNPLAIPRNFVATVTPYDPSSGLRSHGPPPPMIGNPQTDVFLGKTLKNIQYSVNLVAKKIFGNDLKVSIAFLL